MSPRQAGTDWSSFDVVSLWGKFGGLHACGATFPYIPTIVASIRAGFLGLVECRWTQEENKRGADHSGSSFDSFLREEVEAVAIKRLVAWQLKTAMRKQQKKKEAMANLLRRD
jgi:hypothetical protein